MFLGLWPKQQTPSTYPNGLRLSEKFTIFLSLKICQIHILLKTTHNAIKTCESKTSPKVYDSWPLPTHSLGQSPKERNFFPSSLKHLARSAVSGDCLSPSLISFLVSRQQMALSTSSLSKHCSLTKDDFPRPTPRFAGAASRTTARHHPALVVSSGGAKEASFNRAQLLRRALLHPHF